MEHHATTRRIGSLAVLLLLVLGGLGDGYAWSSPSGDQDRFTTQVHPFLQTATITPVDRVTSLGAQMPPASSSTAISSPILTLTVHQRDQPTGQVQVGISEDATGGRDAYDREAPADAPLRLKAPDGRAPSDQQRWLKTEYRSAEADGHTFSLVLQVESTAPVEIRATGLNAFGGQQVVLVDPTTASSYDLHTTQTVTIRPDGSPRSLRLLVGTVDYVKAKKEVTLPDGLQFLPNYPNPFSGQTTLEYVLPEPERVRLTVYNVLGREVRVLVDGKQRAGRHTVQWDGNDETEKRMASGVYLARLVVDGTTKVRRHEEEKPP